MNLSTEIKQDVGWAIALSALMIVAGILAIIVPLASGIAVTILVGWLLILCGGALMAFAWHAHRGSGLFWGILLGLIYIAAGGYLLLHPMAGLKSLTLVLAVYLLLESILEFILAFQLRPLTGSGWLVVDGIITLILAITIACTWPASSPWVIGTLVGISMLFSGVARLTISLATRHAAKELRGELRQAGQGN